MERKEELLKAFKWLLKAAEQGEVLAQLGLGVLYENGKGIPQDKVMAYKWYNIASENGLEDGKLHMDMIEKQITKTQIEETRRLARKWVESHEE